MKKKVYLCVSALAFIFCACDSTKGKLDKLAAPFVETQQKRVEQLVDSALEIKLNDFSKLLPAEEEKFFQTQPIDYRLARLYIQEFRSPMADGRLGVDSSRTESVWIDKGAIAAMMRTLLSNDDYDGIRLYYARYPHDVTEFDPAVKHPKRQTLMLVCTKRIDDITHQDAYKKVGSPVLRPGDDGLYVYDYNSLCPDSCSGANLGGHGPYPKQ